MDPNANYAALGMKQQGLNNAIGAVKETPLTRLSYAVDRLRKAEAHTSEAANKLVGERGDEQAELCEARAPVGSGFLGSIEELADNVTELAGQIISSIQRIERRL